MKEFKTILLGICFVAIFIIGFTKGKQETQLQNPIEEPAIAPQYSYYETLDEVKEVNSKQYIFDNSPRNNNETWNNYSDEEIRTLREKQSFKSDGGYIYTPGRHVPD